MRGQFETLDFYLSTAKRAIGKWGNIQMLRSEDAIAHVAYMIMKADEKFDGRGDIKGFRMHYAKYGILNVIALYKKDKHRKNCISLSQSIRQEVTDQKLDIAYFVELKQRPPDEQLDIDNVHSMVEECTTLRSREKEAVIRLYLYGDTLEQIGNMQGITKEAVRLNVLSGIAKLKAYHK